MDRFNTEEVSPPKIMETCPPNIRGAVLNEVFKITREGTVCVDEVLNKIRAKIEHNKRYGDLSPTLSWWNEFLADNTEGLGEAIDYCLWWDTHSHQEKEKIKAEKQRDFVFATMSQKPPTEKQIAYIKKLGGKVIPKNCKEASDLIEELLKR